MSLHCAGLAPILERLLALGTWGMGTDVEIEFAVDLARRQLAFLQLLSVEVVRRR